jgi:nucleotide-binding universal stress UspA family protein
VAQCPVLIVPPQLGFREAWLTRSPDVLAFTDGSLESWRAALLAAEIAEAVGGSIVLAHVFHDSMVTGFRASAQTSRWHRDAVGAERARRLRLLEGLGERLSAIAPTRIEFLYGEPRAVIPQITEELRGRLISLGSRGLGGRVGALIGSVSMEVASRVAVPTLVVGRRAAVGVAGAGAGPQREDWDFSSELVDESRS